MSRRLCRMAIHALVAVGTVLFLGVLAAASGAWKASPASAATPDCSITGDTATILLSGGKRILTLNPSTHVLQTNSGTNGTPLDCTFNGTSNGQLGKGTDGSGNFYVTNINFDATTSDSQTIEFNETAGYFPCITQFGGSMSSLNQNNGTVQIDAPSGTTDGITVGSDGIDLNATFDCGSEKQPSNIGNYVLVGSYFGTLSAQGQGGTSPTSLPVKFVAGSSVSSEVFRGGSGTSTLDMSNTVSPATSLIVNTTGSAYGANSVPSNTAYLLNGATLVGVYDFTTGASSFTNFIGSSVAATTFAAGNTTGFSFSVPGSPAAPLAGSTLDLSAANTKVTADLSNSNLGTVTLSGNATPDTLTNVYDVVAPPTGNNKLIGGPNGPYVFSAVGNGNTFVGGAGQDTFNAPGANNTFQFGAGAGMISGTSGSSTGDVLDFSGVGNNLSVNVSGVTVPTALGNYTAKAGTTVYDFTALNPVPVTIKGSTNPTTFYAGSAVGYSFQGVSSTDTLDLTNAASAIKADLSVVPNTVTVSGVTGSDTLSGIDAVQASRSGDVFIGGASATLVTFTDTASGVTFKAGSGNETFDDSNVSGGNTYDFSALAVPLTLNVVGAGPNYQATTATATYTLKGLKAPATFLGSVGGTTFKADSLTTGYSFVGEGGPTVADFSASSTAVVVDMHLQQVTVTLGAGSDTLQSILSVIGSTTAQNTFIAGSGAGTETFGDLGTGKQDILDFSNVGTSNTSPLAINVSGAPISTTLNGTVLSYTAALGNAGAGGVTYNFTNSGNGTDFVTVIGSAFGNTVFLVGNVSGAPAYTLCASAGCGSSVVSSDTLDFSSVQTSGASGKGLVVDLSAGPPGTGTAILPTNPVNHVTDSFSGFVSVVGANTGFTTFKSGPTSTFTYSFTGLGNSNTFVAGAGSATFIASGSGNTVDFSQLTVPMTINLSGTSAQSVLPGTAAPTGNPSLATYTFTSFSNIPSTFIGASAVTTFFAGSTGDNFLGTGGFNNTLSFANASGSSLVFCNVVDSGSTVPVCSSSSGLTGPAAVLSGSVLEPFRNIINFVGLPTGNTTFEGDDSSAGLVFTGTGTNNSANFALATNGVKFDFTASPLTATFQNGTSDQLSGVTSAIGSKNGNNTFIAGTSSEVFGAGGTGNAIDFTSVATSGTAPLTINTTSTTFNGVAADTAATSGASYSFVNGAAGFVTFIGAGGGNTDFIAPNTVAGGYQFCPAATYATAASPPTCTTGVVSSNLVDFSAVQTSSGGGNGLIIDLSSPTIGTGLVTLPGGHTAHFYGIVQVIGASTGFTTFRSGPTSAFNYRLTGQGNFNDFIAGTGSATFLSSGSNNTVDFSQLNVGMTINLSSSTAQGVAPGTASPTGSPGSVVYTFSSFAGNPATFFGSHANTVFFAGTTADGFNGISGFTNTLSFANTSGTSLVFCNTVDTGSTVPLCSTSNGLSGQTAVLNGTGLEPFSNITVFVGLPGGNTTFESGDTLNGLIFQGSGSNNTANFALATHGVKFDLSTSPVTAILYNGFTDQLGNVSSVIGSSNGGNTFIAGTGSETFAAGGTGNSIDFTAVPTSGGAPLTVNTSSTSVNGVAPDTAATSSASYNFTSGGAGFVTFIGSVDGYTRFIAPRALTGGMAFCSAAIYASLAATPSCTTPDGATGTDTADFSAITTGGITVTMMPGTNYGTVALGGSTCATACDYIYGITNVIGSAVANVFYGGLDGNNFTSSSTSNTLSYVGDLSTYTNGVTLNLITNSVAGSCVITSTSSCGDSFNFSSGSLTVQGTPSSDTFVIGTRAVKSLQGGGGQDVLNLSNITPSSGTGVSVSLVSGTVTGPSIGGVSFAAPPVADATCANSGDYADLCLSSITGTTGNDVFTISAQSPSLLIAGNGGNQDTLDLSSVSVPATINMPLGVNAGSVTASGTNVSVSITFFGISAVTGTSAGGDHIFVGTGTEAFTETNSSSLGILDYSALSHYLGCQQNATCSYSGPGVSVTTNDISGGFSGSTSSPVTVGAQDTFSNMGRFVGTGGNDTFIQNGASPAAGYSFDGLGGTDTLNLTGTGVTLTINLASSTCGTGNDGSATGSGVNDTFRCISTVLGSSTLYQINPGQAVTINGGGTGILQLVGDTVANGGGTNGATINLTTRTITGDNYNITFSGMQTIYGTPYGDTFIDGPGNYTLVGGGGTDGIDFTNATSAVEANLSSRPYLIPAPFAGAGSYLAADTVTGGDGGTILISGINNIVGTQFFNDLFVGGAGYGNFIGGTGADRFVIFGGGVDRIYGGSGGSTLDLTQLPSAISYLDLSNPFQQFLGGANGYLTLVPGTIATVIAPNSGSDIYAGSGSITLLGGSGSDILSAGSGSQTISGGGGTDTLVGGINGSDTLQGGSAPVTFIPGSGPETLVSSGTGNTLSYDGVSNPVMVNLSNQPYTLPGNLPFPAGTQLAANTASGGNGATVNLLQAGISNVIGSYGNDIFVTGSTGNRINGNGGGDLFVITASTVGNTLTAGAGTNSWFLFVGNSSNTINGGGAATVDFSQVGPGGSPVTVDLVHNSATGGFGGSQSLTGILNIIGSQASGNHLTAGSEFATITSLGANDTLTAAPGGHDTLINSGPGGDTFIATTGNGFDTMIGGVGNDTFFVRDGESDTIDGGGGFNYAQIDFPPVIDTTSNIDQFLT